MSFPDMQIHDSPTSGKHRGVSHYEYEQPEDYVEKFSIFGSNN